MTPLDNADTRADNGGMTDDPLARRREKQRARSHRYNERHRDKRRAYDAARREERRLYYLARRDEKIAAMREWYLKHRDEHRSAVQAYRETHREEGHAAARAWVAAHPKEKVAADRAYRESHHEEVIERNRRRAALKRGATIGPIDLEAIKRRDRMLCCICGKRVAEKDFSLDHSHPLSLGGPHTQENLRVAHLRCNSRRGAGRLPVQMVLC